MAIADGVMGDLAGGAPMVPGYGEMDFRTGQYVDATVQDLAFTDEAARLEQQRLERMARAWRYYQGDHKRSLEVDAAGFDDNVTINKARTVVDKGVSFLFGKPFRLFDGTEKADDTGAASGSADAAPAADPDDDSRSDVETEEQEASPITEAIELLLADKANRGMLLWQKVGQNGGVCGHAWVKIHPRKNRPPRLVALDPQSVSVVLHDDDIDKVLEYVIRWEGISSETGKPYARRQRIIDQNADLDETGPWLIVDERADEDGPFLPLGPPIPWEYDWAPIVGCQNLPAANEFYGISDLEDDLLDLNDALSYTRSNTQRILRFHGHPMVWMAGGGGADVDFSPDVVMGLPEGATVGQIEMQSDLSSASDFSDAIAEAIHEQSRVPAITTGKVDNIGVLSGLAMGILYAPIVEKTEQKQLLYGWLVTETVKRCLELMMLGKADTFDLELEWPEVVPSDAKEEREVAILDNELGASKATLLERLGYDPDSEAEKRASEATTSVDAAQQAFNAGGGPGSPYDAPPGNQTPNGPAGSAGGSNA